MTHETLGTWILNNYLLCTYWAHHCASKPLPVLQELPSPLCREEEGEEARNREVKRATLGAMTSK